MMTFIKRLFKSRGVDRSIYISVVILTIFGIVMIGSASVGDTATYGASYATKNMIKQIVFVLIGYAMMIFFTRCFKKKWVTSKSSWFFYFVGLAAMLSCLAFGDVKGSYAWIKLPGGMTIQPAEFMKIVMILFLSFHFGEMEEMCQIPRALTKEKKEKLQIKKLFYCLLKPLMAIFLVFGIGGFIQKDLGSAMIIFFICLMMGFVTPRPYYSKYKKLILIMMAVAGILLLFGATFILKPYQLGRINTWLHPLEDAKNTGWQLANALIAFSSGGLFGQGFGASKQKFGYIPESHNDFIMAIIYEELGIIGLALIMIPYCIIIFKMFNYAIKINDTKSKLILYGIGTYFFAHLLINIGGVSGFIPMTGVPLLLVSSGGSSTLAAMIGIGIAQSIIAKYNRDQLKEQL
jgi:Bacterial cell division membrane protein